MSDPVLKPTQEQRQRLLPCPFCGSSAGATTTHIYCQSKTCAILHIPFTLAEWQGRRSPDEAAIREAKAQAFEEASSIPIPGTTRGVDRVNWFRVLCRERAAALRQAGLESREGEGNNNV